MTTRRQFLTTTIGAGVALGLGSTSSVQAQSDAEILERNKAAVLRLKQSQGTAEADSVRAALQAPNYNLSLIHI